MTETPIRDADRAKLLEAALPHVVFDGWSWQALEAGAADAGFANGDARRLFPRGPAEAVELFIARTDSEMEDRLARADVTGLRLHERVRLAILTRLEIVGRHREAVRRAVAFLALPGHAVLAARSLAHTVDCMWHAAGDRAADFTYYTKRATLAAVYSATLLHWLVDRSEGFAETEAFLDRRLEDVMRLHKLRTAATDPLRHGPDPFRLFRAFAERS